MDGIRETLSLDAHLLREAAQRYYYPGGPILGDSDPRFPHAGSSLQKRGYALLDELHAIARWKSPRSADLILLNEAEAVKVVTGEAFAIRDREPGRAACRLTEVYGIGIPTASTVLTVFDPGQFGIVDFRVWNTLRLWRPDRFPAKSEGYWPIKHFICCLEAMRELARDSGLSCREIDMALWQMDRERSQRGESLCSSEP